METNTSIFLQVLYCKRLTLLGFIFDREARCFRHRTPVASLPVRRQHTERHARKACVQPGPTGQDLVNNPLRRFKTLCRQAGVGPYTIHDLRRSCITNWAQRLPIHVVQKLAGHSDIQTTETYYLSVQQEDLAKASRMQSTLVGDILSGVGTDPLVTHFDAKGHKCGLKRCFPAPPKKGGQL